jgi:hypothetical protein
MRVSGSGIPNMYSDPEKRKFLVIKSLGLDPDPIYPDPQTLAKNLYFIKTND